MSRTTLRLPARVVAVLPVVAILLLATCVAGCGSESQGSATTITARMLVEPNALVGPGPENLNWSPKGARLAYTLADKSGNETLWLYDASSGEKNVPIDLAGSRDGYLEVAP